MLSRCAKAPIFSLIRAESRLYSASDVMFRHSPDVTFKAWRRLRKALISLYIRNTGVGGSSCAQC
jgi:hypothetical protein